MRKISLTFKYLIVNILSIYLLLKGVGFGFHLMNMNSDEANLLGILIVAGSLTMWGIFAALWNAVPFYTWLQDEGERWKDS